MTLVYSLRTGALLGQRCNDRDGQPADTCCVLTGRANGAHYIDVHLSSVRLEVVR